MKIGSNGLFDRHLDTRTYPRFRSMVLASLALLLSAVSYTGCRDRPRNTSVDGQAVNQESVAPGTANSGESKPDTSDASEAPPPEASPPNVRIMGFRAPPSVTRGNSLSGSVTVRNVGQHIANLNWKVDIRVLCCVPQLHMSLPVGGGGSSARLAPGEERTFNFSEQKVQWTKPGLYVLKFLVVESTTGKLIDEQQAQLAVN